VGDNIVAAKYIACLQLKKISLMKATHKVPVIHFGPMRDIDVIASVYFSHKSN